MTQLGVLPEMELLVKVTGSELSLEFLFVLSNHCFLLTQTYIHIRVIRVISVIIRYTIEEFSKNKAYYRAIIGLGCLTSTLSETSASAARRLSGPAAAVVASPFLNKIEYGDTWSA